MALNGFKKLINPVITYLGRKKERAKFSDTPIMVFGCGRSGTTLLLSIIGAHPNIYAFPKETGVFINWYNEVQYLFKNEKGQGDKVPRLDKFYRLILKYDISNNVTRWCEKTPKNIRYLDKILDYFNEDIKLIHIVRDGRDVTLSRHPNAPDKYWVKPERWVNDVKKGLEYKDHSQVLTIKYENLVLNYEETIEKLCDFINEECTEELYSYFEHTNVQKTNAWYDKAQQVHSKSVEKWKKEENQERVAEVMQNDEVVKLLDELNYL
ncbi:sulfotransferase [Halanaerocella petrolearia]